MVILITGVSSGFGLAMARQLSADGHTVYGTVRRDVEQLPGVHYLRTDVRDTASVKAAVEAIRYYGGIPVGICAIFACEEECEGFPIVSIFNPQNVLTDYQSTDSHDCPLCKAGVRLDALVNAHGISSF